MSEVLGLNPINSFPSLFDLFGFYTWGFIHVGKVQSQCPTPLSVTALVWRHKEVLRVPVRYFIHVNWKSSKFFYGPCLLALAYEMARDSSHYYIKLLLE